jgi:hypothetical protein
MAVTLTGIEETRLIVSILAMVVHKVPVEDLVSLRLGLELTIAITDWIWRVSPRRSLHCCPILRP